jgi:cytochrome P450
LQESESTQSCYTFPKNNDNADGGEKALPAIRKGSRTVATESQSSQATNRKTSDPPAVALGSEHRQPDLLRAELEEGLPADEETRAQPFTLDTVYSPTGTYFVNLVARMLPAFFWFLRNVAPNLRIGRLQFVSRYRDVRDVLDRDDVFEIPFDHNGRKLGWDPGFLLGMQDGPEYQQTKEDVYTIFRRSDIDDVGRMSSHFAYRILEEHAEDVVGKDGSRHGRVDAVKDLIRRVPTLVVEQYFGVVARDKYEFEDCLIALSGYMFGSAGEEEDELPAYAREAFDRVRAIIHASVTEQRKSGGGSRDNIVGRLLDEQAKEDPKNEPHYTDERIVSYLFGMILGFLPTNLMANGNILDALMKHKLERAQARRAALDGDDALLCRCLFETMRRRIPLNPGPWRRSVDDYVLAGNSTRWDRIVRKRLLRKGMIVWPLTQSAMHDSRGVDRPREFDPDRSREHNLVFGDGLHHCIGRLIAETQITQTMKALLRQDDLRLAPGERKGRMKRISLFPLSQKLDYDFRAAEN